MNEKELFDLLKETIYPSLVRSKNKFTRWDCYDINGFNRIELKCRKRHYNDLVIEKGKYDALIKKCIDNLDTPLFIVSTPKGIYCWNLFRENLTWEVSNKYPKNTAWGGSERVTKEVSHLEIKNAIILKEF